MVKLKRASRCYGLDTETTGLDLYHGAAPFFVTVCDEHGENHYWEWQVDELTRRVVFNQPDLLEIQDIIDSADTLILQNPKFDYQALQVAFGGKLRWDWSKVEDTLLQAHLLGSNQPHDLTSSCVLHLRLNIQSLEDKLQKITNDARRWARSHYPDWAIAAKGREDMPSAKEKTWKFDTWLPKLIARMEHRDRSDPWWTALEEYANTDSAVLIPLHKAMQETIKRRNLDRIYQMRRKLLPIVCAMEQRGITASRKRHGELQTQFTEDSKRCGRVCVNIAAGYNYELQLPKSGNNKSLSTFVFEVLKLEPTERSAKTGQPTLDKHALEVYESQLPSRSKPLIFIRNLRAKRKRDTALSYLESYERFWLPFDGREWLVLHPSLNPTGTDTLRWSSQNPNEQNISKQEGVNLRYCFGPAPGREWWSLDAKNIELRLPAYESGEHELIDLFEHPDDPPYYGSTHLLNFHTVYPDIWEMELKVVGVEKVGPHCKKKYASTWYQWCKNGGFAVQYGAVDLKDKEGTADRAFHRLGSHAKLKARFSKLEGLNRACIEFAETHGYIETMPDKTVDPKRGYPLLCTRNKWNKILATVPLNYHIQGTAMWWMCKSMVRCQEYLDTVNRKYPDAGGYYMVMQVHDELVFDFPKSPSKLPNGKPSNYRHIEQIRKLMELGGDDLGVPTPVSVEYHPVSWSEGVSV